MRRSAAVVVRTIGGLMMLVMAASLAAQTPRPALLVLDKDDRELAIVDPVSLRVVGRVPAGDDPHEVVVSEDGTIAFVSNYGALGKSLHTISVVDLVHQQALPAVDLGPLVAPHGLDAANGKIYFTAEVSKVIGWINPKSRQVEWVLGVGQNRTHMLKVGKDGETIYASNVMSDSISVIEKDGSAQGWRETVISVGKGPEGFDVSPDGKELWAANSHDGTASVVDLGSKRVSRVLSVPTRSANRLKFTPDGRMVMISDLGTGDLVFLDARARKEIKRISLGKGCAGILIVPDGSRAFVAVSREDKIAVVDLKSLTVTAEFSTGKGPDGMAWLAAK
jgi:DNA-binding beta-propeller fold protein YncE